MIRYQASPAQPLTVSRSCRRSLIDRMADDMREMAFAGQNVSTETLVQRGWPQKAIKRFSPDAITLARRQSVRRLG